MKQLLVLLTSVIVCSSSALAQEQPDFTHSFSYKKGQETITLGKIEAYLSDVLGVDMQENQMFIGEIRPLDFVRKGNKKESFTVQYRAKYSVNAGKAKFVFWLTEIERTTITCDSSQQEETVVLPFSDGCSSSLLERFEDASDDIVDHIRDYVKKDENYKPHGKSTPYWWDMKYVVENGSVSYFKVLTSAKGLSKEALYKVFENYFTYAYRSGKAVIENKDSQEYSIIAKGIYDDIHEYHNFSHEIYDVSHIIRVQCRDGRVRISFTIGNYDIHRKGTKYIPAEDFTRNITDYQPFGGMYDEEMTECLEKIERQISVQYASMQKAIDEGNTAVDALDDW